MWPFKKKFRPLESLPAEDFWSVASGKYEGKPIVIRRNTTARTYARHPDLPFRLGIAVPLHNPDADGLAQGDEVEQLHEIEDRLEVALGAFGRKVVVISTDGMREFISYVRSAPLAERVASTVRAATATHEVQHYVEPDPQWSAYFEFA